MSIDRSLRVKDALTRHRNVLTRAERIEKLKDEERWEEGTSVMGLPKVAHRKVHAGKKAAEKKETAVEGAVAGVEGAVPAAAGKAAAPGAAKGAPAAKAAAPAAQKPGKEAKKK